jgi:hypothetical protein
LNPTTIAIVGETRIASREATDANPLLTLPEGFRSMVSYLWKSYPTVLKNPDSLVVLIRTWIVKQGLTPEDLKIALVDLSSPEFASTMNFENQFMTEVAGKLASIIHHRKSIKAMLDRRRQAAKDREEAVPIDEFKRRWGERFGEGGLGSLFKGVDSSDD